MKKSDYLSAIIISIVIWAGAFYNYVQAQPAPAPAVKQSGAVSNGNCVEWVGNNLVADTGAACGTGSGSVTSVDLAMPGIFTVTGNPVTTSGTLTATAAGTSGGIPYFSAANALASSAALTANLPVIGGGAGVAPTVGSVSGNTTTFATTTGALNSGNCVEIDASGNLVDSGGACGGGSGGTTQTASASANLTFTLDFTTNVAYNCYLNNFQPATDAADLRVQLSDDGGAVYDNMTTHRGVQYDSGSGATNNVSGFIFENQDSDGVIKGRATIRVTQPLTTQPPQVHYDGYFQNNAATELGVSGDFRFNYTAAVDRLRIIYSAGNITVGTATCIPEART